MDDRDRIRIWWCPSWQVSLLFCIYTLKEVVQPFIMIVGAAFTAE